VTPRVVPHLERRDGRGNGRSSYAEFRSASAAGRSFATSRDAVFWKYLTNRHVPSLGVDALGDRDHPGSFLLDDAEQRVLSKATGAAGGFLVPSDFDEQVTSVRRARNVIGELARQIVTDHGRLLPLPTAIGHGTGSWQAENAAGTATDETFGQVGVNAFKANTSTIVSEELSEDALDDFDTFLSGELGQRLALLEETAFAVGDGSGKPLGIVTSGNGVSTVVAATGSATGFKLADVLSVYAALPDAYKPSASSLMSPSAFRSLAGLTDSAGGLVFPSLQVAEPMLLARPVYVSPELPAAAANARSVVFGDIAAGYAVRRVRGLGVKRLTELLSDQGQIKYRLYERLDGRPVITDALRILVNSAT
jgi:HK97 family phage major capsid protein